MRNLLSLSQLTLEEIQELLDLSQQLKDHKIKSQLTNKKIANLFFEPSTRTHYSFITAQHNLNCHPIDFAPGTSSIIKGETFYDTVKVFESFGVDAIVIRHNENYWYKHLVGKIKVPLINAGDGAKDHPTQSLLDLLTIKQQFKTFKNLNVLIVGDILHSRVAHSNIAIMKRLGMNVFVSAPQKFQDKQYSYVDFDTYLPKVDVINMLRIQKERIHDDINIDIKMYNKQFGLTSTRVKMLKPSAIIIHPAPVNRNVEIDDAVMESKHSKIFSQIENGVYVRMAVLLWTLHK